MSGTRRSRKARRLVWKLHVAGCDYCQPSKLYRSRTRAARRRDTRKAADAD